MDTGHYLACFGLVPYSFLGLFLCLNYVVHRLGHVLLYVVYYVPLKKEKEKQQQQTEVSISQAEEWECKLLQCSAGRAVFRCCARTLLTAG